jgi:cell volume regulation protein A
MFFGVAFIVVLISLILQGWTVATAARMFDLDVPPLQQASRLDIDLPGRLGDENTVAGYRVEARCRAASKPVEALPLPPTASVPVVIRDGIAHSAASASPLAPGDYVFALARPEDLALLDRAAGRMSGGCSASSRSTELPHSPRLHTSMTRQRPPMTL